MMKNLFKFSLALFVSAFMSLSAKAETVITVVDWQSGVGGITNAYADFIKEFEAANPGVKVEYTQYTVSTYNEYLKPALSSGQGPDVFAVYPGPDVDEVMGAGHLVNITAEADDEWKSWLGNNINIPELSRNGNLYLAPQDAFTEEIWVYNDMIEDLGFELPAFGDSYTVDEWVAIGKAAKEKGLDGLMFGPVESWCVFDGFANFVNQGNDNYPEDSLGMALDGKISWDQPMFRDALNAYKTLNDNRFASFLVFCVTVIFYLFCCVFQGNTPGAIIIIVCPGLYLQAQSGFQCKLGKPAGNDTRVCALHRGVVSDSC